MSTIKAEDYVEYVKKLVTNKYKFSYLLDDLVSVGYFALVKAVKTFDPSREIKFATYLQIRVLGEIADFQRTIPSLRNRSASKQVNESSLDILTQTIELSSKKEVNHEELIQLLKRNVKNRLRPLGARNSEILIKKYFELMSGRDIAKQYDLTPSRISMIAREAKIEDLIEQEIKELT